MKIAKHGHIALLAGACLVLCAPGSLAQTPFEPVLHLVVTVAPGEEAPLEALLLEPTAVLTDSYGRIYVADRGDFRVKTYDNQSRFMRAVGGKGHGPGEFQNIAGLAIDRAGNLLVADIDNSRITRFSPDGSLLKTTKTELKSAAGAKAIIPISDGDYVTLFVSVFLDANTPIFHVINDEFTIEKMSFGPVGNHGEATDSFWLRTNSGRPGNFWMESDARLIYAPFLYTGKLFRYERQDQKWELAHVLEGRTKNVKAFKRVDPEYFQSGLLSDGLMGAVLHFRREEHAAITYNHSQHVFVLRDGRIVHFSLQYVGDGYRLFLEVFDTDGALIGYGPITRLAGADDIELHKRCRFVWKDNLDQFYLLERGDNPRIHVVSLSY